MTETNLETGLRYVRFDHSDTRIRQSQFIYTPDWRWEYVELLRRREYRAAQQLREQGMPDSSYRRLKTSHRAILAQGQPI